MTVFVQDPDLTIHVGDALEVLRTLPTGSARACVTSPPYLDARPEYSSPTVLDFERIFRELGRVVTDSAIVNVGRIFRGGREVRWQEDFLRAAERAGWWHLDTRVWVKPNANPIRGNVFTDSHEYLIVLGHDRAELNVDGIRRPHAESTKERFGRAWVNHRGVKQARDSRARKTRAIPNPLGALPRSYVECIVGGEKGNEHPAPMPLAIAESMVALATWPGDMVIDPFAGSGTTAVAARRHGRRSILIELNPVYAQLAADRLSQLSLLAEGAA